MVRASRHRRNPPQDKDPLEGFMLKHPTGDVRKGALVVARHTPQYKCWVLPQTVQSTGDNDKYSSETRAKLVERATFLIIVAVIATVPARDISAEIPAGKMDSWKTLIGTLYYLVISTVPMADAISSRTMSVPKTVLNDIAKFALFCNEVSGYLYDNPDEEVDDNTLDEFFHKANLICDMLGFPRIVEFDKIHFYGLLNMGTVMEIACYFALVVYLAGRPVSEKTVAILQKRPQNLIDKFGHGAFWQSVGGDWSMSEEGARMVSIVWASDQAFRCGLFRAVMGLPYAETDPALSAVATMVSLLEYAQLAHVVIIGDFLMTYPWVIQMPELSREIAKYKLDMMKFHAIPKEEKCFAKILQADMLKCFVSSDIGQLTGLAVSVMRTSQKSLAGYALTAVDGSIRAAFDRQLAAHQPIDEEEDEEEAPPDAAPGSDDDES